MAECIEWWGTRDSKGYGVLKRNGRMVKAHRMVWEECFGPIPEDKPFILHHCDNPPCVNPECLFPGTNADNMADKQAKGRGIYPGAPRREVCKEGHRIEGDNVVTSKRRNGGVLRRCRICVNRRALESYHRRKNLQNLKNGAAQ